MLTTDTASTPKQVASAYVDRWAIEGTSRDVKHVLGTEDPQAWVGESPPRVVAHGCWLTSAIRHRLGCVGHRTERTSSFFDAGAPVHVDQ
ncbi:MAG TPA: hypothetical protein VMW47_09135 [Verrucomicrobiae bacterium]|nr:hypothetical protein [Verrucomicrobiae bacterium]